MKLRFVPSFLFPVAVFGFMLLLAGCQAPTASPEPLISSLAPVLSQTSVSSVTPLATQPEHSSNYLTQVARPTRIPYKTPTSSSTPTITPTASSTAQQIDAIPAGAGLAPLAVPIQQDNLPGLRRVAQWGKGPVLRLAFSGDGKSLLVGSPFGVAVYSMEPFTGVSLWKSFEAVIYFESMDISQDGNLVRLAWERAYPASGKETRIFDLENGKFESNAANINWLTSNSGPNITSRKAHIISPDGRLRLNTSETFSYEGDQPSPYGRLSGEIINNKSGKELAKLQQETLFVEYWDRSEPDGCDLTTFSYCGNVYDPIIMDPYRAAFSTTGKSLAILYRPLGIWSSHSFSLLRVYSTQDGSLINGFGSFEQPVEDFAFQPGSDRIAVAFVSGSIQIWEPAQNQLLHQMWDFRSTILGSTISQDGQYLTLQYEGAVEVIKTDSGAVLGRYEASAFALSPRENLLALGNRQGGVQVENLDQRRTISHMTGHNAEIYGLVFSPDGLTLTSSSADCTLRNWDVNSGQFLHYFEEVSVNAIGESWTKSRIFVYYMAYVPGRNQMVGFGSWGTAASWDAQSGAKQFEVISQPLEYYNGMQTLNPHFPGSIWVVPEDERFYIEASAYDLDNGELVGGYLPPKNQPRECSPAGPLSFDNGVRFAVGYGSLSGQICVLEEEDNQLMYRITVFSAQNGEAMIIRQVFLSPDKTRLFVVSQDGPVFVYQVSAEGR